MKGALVVSVFKGSPAEKGGILPGDFIQQADGKGVNDANQLTRIVGNLPPNRDVEFVLIRYGKEQRLKVTLKARDAEDSIRANTAVWPGMTVVKLTEDFRKQLKAPATIKGLLIADVAQGTQAQSAGLKSGDILVKINDKETASVLEFYRMINDKAKGEIIFRLWRENKEIILGVVR
jgi:S1-C subfamily serine protease